MQSNDNPEMKDIFKMDNSRAITVHLPSEMGEDNAKTSAASSPTPAPDVESAAASEAPNDAKEIGEVTKVNVVRLDDGMMPPPAVQGEGQTSSAAPATLTEPRPPSSASATSDKDEDEVLSLQVLSGRSSTPYTVQAACCGSANCELGTTDSTTVSPVKEEEPAGLASDGERDELVVEAELRADVDLEGKKYSRSDLITIRDEMTIVRPECLGSARVKRLNLLKSENGSSGSGGGGGRNKSYRSGNIQNDLMPAFFKRKTTTVNGNGITYDTFHAYAFPNRNDSSLSNPTNNHRRIGSGRLSNRDINWDYIPEEDPEKDNLPEFFTTKTDSNTNNNSNNSNSNKPQQRHTKKYDLDDNANYVKRVINSVVGESSFRSAGSKNSTSSSTEDRYSAHSSTSTSNNANKSDEPEWFSCGPTSRLDTIELCGFDESDERQIRLELSNVKSKIDANNNVEDKTMATTTGTTTATMNGAGGHKEKKHLAFQFDDFSTHAGKANNSSGGSGSRIGSSKFMPLFNAKNKETETTAAGTAQNGAQSLSDFFKRNDLPSVQKEKLSLTEIPSVDEIEAKCRIQQQQSETKHKTSVPEAISSTAENFKKMINQLNQQNPGLATVAPTPSHQPPPSPQPQQPAQPVMNLFNSDNLSNFIKQRNLHQQLLQKQQQAFAQLQYNAILSRPETQMLLLSLARGEISKHGLVVQLSNPNLTQADREAISAVLTFAAAGQYQQQLAISNNHQQFIASQLQNLALLQQMNKNALSKRTAGAGVQANGNGGGAGSNMRPFSQEELQTHANLILHNAMMKKKLEEQTNLGMQKILQLQNSMLSNGYVHNPRGEALVGPKAQPQQQQQLQQQQQQQAAQQQRQRPRKGSNAGGSRGNQSGRRRSTSSSSSNAAVSAVQMKLAADLEFRQLEQRRNTIATSTVGADEFLQISQNI